MPRSPELLSLVGVLSIILMGQSCDTRTAQEPSLVVEVAALQLPGVGFACYDLRINQDAAQAGAIVWSRGDSAHTLLGQDQTRDRGATDNPTSPGDADTATVCSDAYGSGGGGDVSFVGTCDADGVGGHRVNSVTIWLDGLYTADGSADLGDWRDPCGAAGCTLDFDCVDGADARVTFDLTVARTATQGFFDVAVSFDDIFCSAKLDTCYPAAGGGAPSDPIELLHNADGTRAWTGVFGFACTSAPGTTTATTLLYSNVAISCGATTFYLDPSAAPGNAVATAGTDAVGYGIYRGNEELDCGGGAGSCQKRYWNTAVNLDDLAALGGDCSLSIAVTANGDGAAYDADHPAQVASSGPT